jgi:hypothetical protein
VAVFLFHLRVWLASWVFLVPNFCWQSPTIEIEKPVAVWFVPSDSGGKIDVDPFATVTQGNVAGIPNACKVDDPKYKECSEGYLKPGASYFVWAGGAAAGKVSFGSATDEIGNLEVTYTGTARIRGRVMALASTLPEASGRENRRQAPSASERAAAIKLARELYQQARVPESVLANITVENLTRTVLKPKSEPSLIGSFNIEETLSPQDIRRHYLFFVASLSGGQLKPELSELRISSSPEDSQSLSLVDQADMFGSGEDNLVLLLTFYENYRYRIYRRAGDGNHWEKLFETETMGSE